MANAIERSQYLERESILGHFKTILVVQSGGQGTLMVVQCSRARFLENETLFLIIISCIRMSSSPRIATADQIRNLFPSGRRFHNLGIEAFYICAFYLFFFSERSYMGQIMNHHSCPPSILLCRLTVGKVMTYWTQKLTAPVPPLPLLR